MISTFFPVLGRIDDDIDDIEDIVIDDRPRRACGASSRSSATWSRCGGWLTPLRDVFARNAEHITELPGMEPDDRPYFRDLYDSMIRVADLVDSYRDPAERRHGPLPLDGRQPPGRGQQAAHDHRHDLPAAHVPDGLLRSELLVPDQPHHRLDLVVSWSSAWAAGRLHGRLHHLLQAQALAMSATGPSPALLERYADLLVNYALGGGAGVQRGETAWVVGTEDTKPLFFAACRAVWRAGGNVIQDYLPAGRRAVQPAAHLPGGGRRCAARLLPRRLRQGPHRRLRPHALPARGARPPGPA